MGILCHWRVSYACCRRVSLGWSCRRPKRFTEADMLMLTSPARNNGWQPYGQPTLTFDQKRGEVICGQVITKVVEGKTYDPELDLSKLRAANRLHRPPPVGPQATGSFSWTPKRSDALQLFWVGLRL